MAADITPFIADAQKTQRETGIPASIVLGQIILESSGKFAGGLSGLAANAKNLFGIKGSGSAGSYYVPTKEWENGRYVTVQANFRKYNSYSESIADHAKLLQNKRYATQFATAKTVEDYATGLQKAGYATSPTYASKLIGIIDSYGLRKYDTGSISYNPNGPTHLHSESGTSSGSQAPTTQNGSMTSNNVEGVTNVDRGFAGNMVFTINRIILILLVLIIGVVFFMKAFPATSATLDTAASVVSPTKKLKAITGGKKGRKRA